MSKLPLKIFILISILAFSSCKDWLYLEPENGITYQEYWQSETDVYGAVMGIYASMLSGSGSGSKGIPEQIFEWGELRSEMVVPYRSLYDYYTYLKNGDINPQLSICKWNSFYRTINYCNTLLEEAPKVISKDASFTTVKLNQFRSEALAVRALLYLTLTKTYGEVPLVLEATTSDQQQFRRAKSSRQEIMDQILKDLKEAEKYAIPTYGNNALNKGRITLYTVKAIEADAYLWASDYTNCVKACDVIINSGQYSLVERNDDWFSTLYVNKNSVESIFELQYSTDIVNPLYSLCETPGYYRANVDAMDFFFPSDPYALSDSLDIRGDKGSYRSSRSYIIWKYTGLNKTDAKTTADIYFNFILYRYAEILLFKAEALAQDNGDNALASQQEALNLIKQVRNRANATDESDEETPFMDKRSLTDFVLSERAREFAFEGKRWYDILRVSKRDNYSRKDVIQSMLLRSAPPERLVTILNKYQDTLFHYLPIPQSDIDAGYPDLIQNPAFSDK
jgi:hypothetical protein